MRTASLGQLSYQQHHRHRKSLFLSLEQATKQRTRAMKFFRDIFKDEGVDCIITPGVMFVNFFFSMLCAGYPASPDGFPVLFHVSVAWNKTGNPSGLTGYAQGCNSFTGTIRPMYFPTSWPLGLEILALRFSFIWTLLPWFWKMRTIYHVIKHFHATQSVRIHASQNISWCISNLPWALRDVHAWMYIHICRYGCTDLIVHKYLYIHQIFTLATFRLLLGLFAPIFSYIFFSFSCFISLYSSCDNGPWNTWRRTGLWREWSVQSTPFVSVSANRVVVLTFVKNWRVGSWVSEDELTLTPAPNLTITQALILSLTQTQALTLTYPYVNPSANPNPRSHFNPDPYVTLTLTHSPRPWS